MKETIYGEIKRRHQRQQNQNRHLRIQKINCKYWQDQNKKITGFKNITKSDSIKIKSVINKSRLISKKLFIKAFYCECKQKDNIKIYKTSGKT